ncbi:hypothetical protein FRC12_002073 [Ceratobasidium sp. 428]|nr:hypothetical protein FRC12_002073 [Ceratobasidium sp. 428]
MTSVLEDHFRDDGSALSTLKLHTLAQSTSHYLVGLWPRELDHNQHGALPVLLARVFATTWNTAPDIARAAAMTLAAGAFASQTYPGGERPATDDYGREKRAVMVLQHYQTSQLDMYDDVIPLFVFGLFSWLPWFVSEHDKIHLSAIVHHIHRIVKNVQTGSGPILLREKTNIATMPEQFSLVEHAIRPAAAYLSTTADGSSDELLWFSACLLPFFVHRSDPHNSHTGVYLIALITLCRAEIEDRALCLHAITHQDIPRIPLQELISINGAQLLEHLCRDLFRTDTRDDGHSHIIAML